MSTERDPSRQEQMQTVAEIVVAGSALLLDWANESVQRTRTQPCDDDGCGYASCRLANAIAAYLAIADENAP